MVKVMTSVEIKAMNIVIMFQVFCLKNEGYLVTANLLTEEVAESVIPDPIRIQILSKVLYNKNIQNIPKLQINQFLIKTSSSRKHELLLFSLFWPFMASLDQDPKYCLSDEILL